MAGLIYRVKDKLLSIDFFSLGNSTVINMLVLFWLAPVVIWLKIPSRFINDWFITGVTTISSRALLYIFVGMITFIIGYQISLIRKDKLSSGFLKKEWNERRFWWIFSGVFIVGLGAKIIRIAFGGFSHIVMNAAFTGNGLYALLGLLDLFSAVAIVMAFVYQYQLLKKNDGRYKMWRLIAWAVLIIDFLYGVFSLSKFLAIMPIVIYVLTANYAHKKSLLRIIVAIAIVIGIVFPLMNLMKNPAYFIREYIIPEKIGSAFIPNPIAKFANFALDTSVNRLDQSRIVTAVIDHTTSYSPGKSITDFIVNMGPPRFLWPNKPRSLNASGNEFGRNIGIIGSDSGDFSTSIGPTFIGDWYINFGLAGIIVGMFLTGIFFRWIYDYLIIKNGGNFSALVIYAMIWIQLVKGMEDWMAPVYAGLVKLIVMLLVIHVALTFVRRSKTSETQ